MLLPVVRPLPSPPLILKTLKPGSGTGAYKLGVNYAPGILPQKQAALKGYAQNLWLHGPEHYLTEVGTMNLFVIFRMDNGGQPSSFHLGTCAHFHSQGYELVTPPLDGMILPGVTRDSVLSLAREHTSGSNRLSGLPDDLTVSERSVTMSEVKASSESGKLVELFGAGMFTPSLFFQLTTHFRWIGTAAVISPVDRIGYLGQDVHIPTGPDGMGPISRPIWNELVGRQTGTIPSDWSVTI